MVAIRTDIDIAVARLAGGQLADELGFDTIEKHSLVTSISELAANIFFHAGEGAITLRTVTRSDGQRGIEVVANDDGAGIADIDFALRDCSSTQGRLGGGLPGVNRLMSELKISSARDKGTVVRAVKWMAEPRVFKRAGSR